METTKDAQVVTIGNESEEQEWELLISLFKKVKVTTSFVDKLEKEQGYLNFSRK